MSHRITVLYLKDYFDNDEQLLLAGQREPRRTAMAGTAM